MSDISRFEKVSNIAVVVAIVLGLYLSSLHSYLLFHSLVEYVSIAIGFSLFILARNSHRFLSSHLLSILGIGYACIAVIDLLHVLSYKGMNVFPGYDANLPTQLWIAARSLQTVTLCVAPLFVTRRVDQRAILVGYSLAVVVLVALVMSGHFPDCYIEGQGFTPFKVTSEYAMSGLLFASLLLFFRKRNHFSDKVFFPLVGSIACTVFSELAFTQYLSGYGPANLAGHFFKLAAVYLMYRAILVNGIKEPFELIFRELGQAEQALIISKEGLEQQVVQRTKELEDSNALLNKEIAERHQSENSLHDAYGYFQNLIAAANVMIVGRDAAGRIQLFNDFAQKLTGYTPAEMTAKDGFQKVVPKEHWEIYRNLQEGTGRLPETLEHPILTKSGAECFISWRNSVLSAPGGPLTTISYGIDITQRKQAEEALRKMAEEVLDLYNQAPCGYHSLDREGLVVRMNDTELQWLGYTRDEVVGKMHFTDLVTAKGWQIWQENFPLLMERGWSRDLEFEMVRRNGSVFPVLLSATAVYDHGTFVMSRGTLFDLSALKQAEAQATLLSDIVQFSDDAIVAKDLDGIILSWNDGARRIYGYRPEEVLGRSVALLVPPEHPDELSDLLARIRRGERVEHFTTQRVCKDGRQIVVSLTISPISNDAGEVIGASSIARDVTKQKQSEEEIVRLNVELEQRVEARTLDLAAKRTELEENQRALMNIVEDLHEKTMELEQANLKLREFDRLKSMFIASMSHELRTPLNSIIGFSSILHDEWIGPVNAEQKENLAIILRCGKHLLSLINDVIDVSKIEAGKIESIPEEFDLYALIEEAVGVIEKALEEKGLQLRVTAVHQSLYTDRRRLLQCLLNLLSNAVKFTEQGSVEVETRMVPGPGGQVPAEWVEIAVTDSGIGIRDEDLKRMFEPFVRLASPLQTTVPGTGLGLYLTRKLAAEVLKGDILLTSEYGKGSRFTLRVPMRLP